MPPHTAKCLCPVHLESLFQIVELFLTGLTSGSAEHHLCAELPVLGHIPRLLDTGVDQGVVVLEVGAETFGLQGSPGNVLRHTVGVDSPGGELVGVERELLLHAFDNSAVDEEEDLYGVSSCRV
jgi:hypothetical protein